MQNNPLLMQQILNNMSNVNMNKISPAQSLSQNLDNRLAMQNGTLQQQRDINQINYPRLYEIGLSLNNIHPSLGETYRDWVYNPLTNTSAPYGTFNNNVPGNIEPHYSRLLIPEENINNWERK